MGRHDHQVALGIDRRLADRLDRLAASNSYRHLPGTEAVPDQAVGDRPKIVRCPPL